MLKSSKSKGICGLKDVREKIKIVPDKRVTLEEDEVTEFSNLSESDSMELPEEEYHGGDEFEIERIVNFKEECGEKMYKIKWKGYSREECSWETEGNLERCHQFITKFFEELDHLTQKREIFKLKLNPETGKVSLKSRTLRKYPISKFCNKNKDFYPGKPKEEQDEELSDITNSSEDKKAAEESSETEEYSVSSLDSAKVQPEGLVAARARHNSQQEKKKVDKKKEDGNNKNKGKKIKKDPCLFFEGYEPLKIIGHRFAGKAEGLLKIEVLVKWRKNLKKDKRPKPCFYLADSLQILCPDLLAEYYKTGFIKILDNYKSQREEATKKRIEKKKAVRQDLSEKPKKKRGRKLMVDYLGAREEAARAYKEELERDRVRSLERIKQSLNNPAETDKHAKEKKKREKSKKEKKDKDDKKNKQNKKSEVLVNLNSFTQVQNNKSNYFTQIREEDIFFE